MYETIDCYRSEEKKKKKISVDLNNIVLIEQTGKTCAIVIGFNEREFIYATPYSFEYMYSLTQTASFGFMEN